MVKRRASWFSKRGRGTRGSSKARDADETKTQVLVVTQWESRHAWAQAHWDQDIGNGIVALVESATSFDVHSYDPIAVVRLAKA